MFAIIQTGGKQYEVREGQVLMTELLEQEPGSSLTFDALLVAEEDGSSIKVGKPHVGKVTAKVVEHGREDKVTVVKYKPKVRYRRHVGHRQPFTRIRIETITA